MKYRKSGEKKVCTSEIELTIRTMRHKKCWFIQWLILNLSKLFSRHLYAWLSNRLQYA